MEDALQSFVILAISEKTNQMWKLELPKLTDEEVRVLSEKAGLDLSGYRRVIDNFGVRHAVKNHGNEDRELLRGQLAIQPEDFLLIFNIVVGYEDISMEYNRIGNMIIRYKKSFAGFRLIFAEEIRVGRKELAFQTLYKQKIRRS